MAWKAACAAGGSRGKGLSHEGSTLHPWASPVLSPFCFCCSRSARFEARESPIPPHPVQGCKVPTSQAGKGQEQQPVAGLCVAGESGRAKKEQGSSSDFLK